MSKTKGFQNIWVAFAGAVLAGTGGFSSGRYRAGRNLRRRRCSHPAGELCEVSSGGHGCADGARHPTSK